MKIAWWSVGLWLLCQPAWAEPLEARLQWAQRVELTTPVSGQIDRVLVDAGDRVEKGEALLALDAREFRNEVAHRRAEVTQAKERLDEAERELERGEELFDRQVISIHELQLVKIALTEAQSAYRSAVAQLRQAELRLENSVIRAPFDAVILQRLAEPAQTVVSRLQTSPLLVIARSDQMLARALADDDRLQQVRVGQPAQVQLRGRSVQGEVARIGLEPHTGSDAAAPRYPVDVRFPLSDLQGLRAGQVVSISLQPVQ